MKQVEPGLSVIVKTVTRMTVGLILIYGIYLAAHGHISPGGGAAGGVIIALSLIHIMLAFGKEEALRKLSPINAVFWAALGGLLFLFFLGQNFGIIPVDCCPIGDAAIALITGFGLFSVFRGLLVCCNGEKK